jgi:S-adenosylhomocysteine hydrolase
MFFQESEVLQNKYPEYKNEIDEIDKFLHSLKPEEQSQMNIEVISDIINVPPELIEFIFQKYCDAGLLKNKKILFCPIEDAPIKEIKNKEDNPVFSNLCDICGSDHQFTKDDLKNRYSLQRFAKTDIDVPNLENNGINSKKLTNNEIEEISESMRLLNFVGGNLDSRPFEGKRFVIILHFLKDLIPFMECCEKLGLKPDETILFYKEYLYPHKESLIDYFQKKGYKVSSLDSLDDILINFQDKCKNDNKPIIIIEDGGYIVPKVHESKFSVLKNQIIGAVEQTTKGERRDKKVQDLNFPVISVAGSILKNTYEPPHIARTVTNNLQNLLKSVNFSSQNALVIGYGSIGKSIAQNLEQTLNMVVMVTDQDSDKLLAASQEMGISTSEYPRNAVKNKFLIIGATGEASIGLAEISNMSHNVYLVSASSDQVEIGLKVLKSLSSHEEPINNESKVGTKYTIRGSTKTINLICDGYPINFCADESMPNEASDLIMTLILLSAVEIHDNYKDMVNKIDSEAVNILTKKYSVSDNYRLLYNLDN